jgi:hypothetical protein
LSFGRRGVDDFFFFLIVLFLSDLTSFTFLSFDHGVFDGESSGCGVLSPAALTSSSTSSSPRS